MNRKYFIAIVLALFVSMAYSQFLDEMEFYTVGEPIQYAWWGQGNCAPGPGCNLMSSDVVALSGDKSGLVPGDGTTRAGLDMDNWVFGQIYFNMWMYVPANKEALMQVMDHFPVGDGAPIFGNIFFNKEGANPGVGYIDDCPNAPIYFEFPHDQWFRLKFIFDLSEGIELGTMYLKVDNELVIPYGTPFTNSQGVYPTAVGGMQFLSTSANCEFYMDDLAFLDDILNSSDFDENKITIYPNPTADYLTIKSQTPIQEIHVFNALGQKVMMSKESDQITVSHLPSGIYFMEITMNGSRKIQRFIKN